jgi:hypothetical protein
MPKILSTGHEISDAIKTLFMFSRARRVIITAFVGIGTERYLPDPSGIELVCWPKPDSTSPNAIRVLMGLGVEVFFADNLHMKVYWAKDQGAVVTSANLTSNGLGGGLSEIGVLLTASEFDEPQIDRILLSLKKRPVSVEEFRQFEQIHTQIERLRKLKLPGAKALVGLPEDRTPPSFKDWHDRPFSKSWKIATFIRGSVPLAKKAKEILRKYGVDEAEQYISVDNQELNESDWVLFFQEGTIDDPFWFFVDAIVPVSPEEPAYRHGAYQLIQVGPNEVAELPFQLSERFNDKIAKVISKLGGAKWLVSLNSVIPPQDFVEAIYEFYC